VLNTRQVLSYQPLGRLNSSKGSLLLAFKTVCLKLKGTLFANRNAFYVAFYIAKDVFRTTTRVFLIRNNILKILFLTLKTQEHFKTSTLDSRYKRLTLFVLLS
jgi:hypothetical protein